MSESSSEQPETGLIPDEDLPDDLNPGENPLARDPDDDPDADDGAGGSAAAGPGSAADTTVEGMPDAGNPTAGG